MGRPRLHAQIPRSPLWAVLSAVFLGWCKAQATPPSSTGDSSSSTQPSAGGPIDDPNEDGWDDDAATVFVPPTDSGPELEQACPDGDLGARTPASISGTNQGQSSNFEPTCADTGSLGSDTEFSFVAPADATYLFTTEGSDFDTVLGIFDGDCDNVATQLACNDDAKPGSVRQAELMLALLSGQHVTAAVDGYNGTIGQVELAVRTAHCGAATDLGRALRHQHPRFERRHGAHPLRRHLSRPRTRVR